MKHLFFTIINLLLVTSFGFAQEGDILSDTIKNKSISGEQVGNQVEVRPNYPGGIQEFYKFFNKNYKVPNQTLKGNVIVSFVVQQDGSLTDFKVIKDLGYGTGKEAIRVLKKSKKWNPGSVNGEIVKVTYTLPIHINHTKK